MLVNGLDHDMLIIADMLTLADNRKGSNEAYERARVEDGDAMCLSPEEVAMFLLGEGEPAIAYQGDEETTLLLAKGYAQRGCPTMIRVRNPHNLKETVWHLVVDPVNSMIGTICHEENPGPAHIAGGIEDFYTGAAVTIPKVVTRWQGSWDRVWKQHTPQ